MCSASFEGRTAFTDNKAGVFDSDIHGPEKIGKIKVGCWADLLVFNDNPMDDISKLKFPKMVIKSGKII